MPREIWHLGWISFFNDVASEMAYPILPLFMIAIKASSTAMGLVEGVAEGLASFMKGYSGIWSDETRRRVPFVQAGYGLSALGKPMIALAGAWPLVLCARVLDRFGKGVRNSARDALIADTVTKEQRGAAFGLHRAMDTAGAFFGVMLTFGILQWTSGHGVSDLTLYRNIFLISFVPGVLAVGLTLLLREPKHDGVEGERRRPDILGMMKSLPGGYWRAVSLALVFALANSSDTFILRYGGTIGLTPGNVILGYALYNATYFLMSYPAGLLSDKVGRWAVMAGGWLIYALVYLGLAMTKQGGTIWLLFGLYGVYMGATDGVSKALVSDHAPSGSKGTAIGIFFMLSGFVTVVSNLIAGELWDHAGPQATFYFGAVVAVLSVLMIPVMVRKQPAT